MTHDHPVWTILDKLQMDNRAQAAKLTELRALVSNLPLESTSRATCPTCGIPFRGKRSLSEHVYNSHDGPVPDHYLVAERLAGDAA